MKELTIATITKDQLGDLSDFLLDTADATFPEEAEDAELGVFRTYSGRGMYGKECIGMVLSDNDAFKVAMALGDWIREADLDYDLADAFKNPHIDSMGYDTIYYWPSLSVEAEDAAE